MEWCEVEWSLRAGLSFLGFLGRPLNLIGYQRDRFAYTKLHSLVTVTRKWRFILFEKAIGIRTATRRQPHKAIASCCGCSKRDRVLLFCLLLLILQQFVTLYSLWV